MVVQNGMTILKRSFWKLLKNKFGRKFRYVVHKLSFSEMQNAVEIYKKLQKVNP